MFTNNDRSINSNFFYKKPVVIGVLDDGDSDPNDMRWMFDKSWESFKQQYSESSLQELVIGLVEIFRGGQPNYTSLGEMFGSETNVDGDEEKVVYSITNVERNLNDIIRVEMYLDPIKRNITDLLLYVREKGDLLPLKEILNERFEGLSINLNGKFTIAESDYKLIIIY